MEGGYDVVIIGGGISGLYSAWRLGKETDLKILLLESTDRYGGRFHTVTMPGGYRADLGAMRFSHKLDKIVSYLVEALQVETKESMAQNEPSNTLPSLYWGGERADCGSDLYDIIGVTGEDKKTLMNLFSGFDLTCSFEDDIDVPDDGNLANSTIKKTGQKANDLTVGEYLSLTVGPIAMGVGALLGSKNKSPLTSYLSCSARYKDISKPGSMQNIVGGFNSLTSAIVGDIKSLQNVDIKLQHDVISVEEQDQHQFIITIGPSDKPVTYKGEKIIFACASNGMDKIQLISSKPRQEVIKNLLSQTFQLPIVKVFMTYTSAWWKEYGLFDGSIVSNMLIHRTIAFGNSAVMGGYATILVAYTPRDIDKFQDLEGPQHARYENKARAGEDIPKDLVPSEALVEHCEQQLCKVLGCDEPPEKPICAVRKYWGVDGVQGYTQHPKPGSDSNKLHWESVKPFSDADIYMASDCFPPSDRTMFFMGFAEGPLLTSERILVNHFGLNPVRGDLCLENPWP